MNNTYAIVLTTCASEEDAKTIIASLLEKKLAACIQQFPINSFYSWHGDVCNDKEITLLIKCNRNNYADIEKAIIEKHNYELPEIILIPIDGGYSRYLSWIDEVTK